MSEKRTSRWRQCRRGVKWILLISSALIGGLTVLDWLGIGLSYWRMPYPYGKRIDFHGGVLSVMIEHRGGMSPMLIMRDDLEVVRPMRPLEWWRWNAYRWGFTLPTWAVSLAIVAPTGWLWWCARSKRRIGACVTCGYDLGGLPQGAPCPECGRAR